MPRIEKRNCPCCGHEVTFESDTQRDKDDDDWTSIKSIDHPSTCMALKWCWYRGEDRVEVIEKREPPK